MSRDSHDFLLTLSKMGDFLAKFSENSDQVYWISSPDFSKIQYVSPSYEKIWGRSRGELYNEPQSWITFFHPEDVSSFHPLEKMAEEIRLKGEKARYSANYRIIRPDGEIRWINDHGFPLMDETGHCYGVTGVAIDVTDEHKAIEALKIAKDAAEAASEAKTEFLDNMRHDIRTPLTGIVGFADLLKLETDDPRIREYSENLVASSHALLDLLDEVLEAIRVSSGEIPKLKKKFSLEQTLKHVIELNRSCAAQKKLSLSLDIDSTLPKFVIGDKVRLHRVALELVANALNFTDSGFVKLSAFLAKRTEDKVILKIEVEDTGIGIPKEKQQEIYVQFKRLTPSYQGIYKGAGLGLSVVKQFIDELDGEIYVESEPRRGTRFTCLIPLQQSLIDDASGVDEEFEKVMDAPYETTLLQEIKPTILRTDKQAFKVLLVEDNPIAQKVAESILSKLRCSADSAQTGKEAIDMWKAGHYDLVFMDIGLPDMDGYEVTHQIRLQELARKTHIPIIALTAHAGEENKKRCIEGGSQDTCANGSLHF